MGVSLLGAVLYMLFILSYSMLLFGIHRKLVARMQNRKGPPVLQPFYDIIKLLGKENLSYRASSHELWLALALLTITLSCLLLTPFQNSVYVVKSSAVLVMLLLSASYLFLILSGLGSSNIFGEVGSMRALLQFLSFEGAFIITVLWPVYYVSRSMVVPLPVDEMMLQTFPVLALVYLLTILPQLNLQPFNIPDAHQEIVSGYATEFSSVPYAIKELVSYLKLYALISLFVLIYLHGPVSFLNFLLISVLMVFLLSIIRASLARTRVKSTLKIYFPLTIIAALMVLVHAYV